MDTKLYHAVIKDDAILLKMLLRNGGNPDVWLEDVSACSGKYLLHTCCEKGRYKCAKVFTFNMLNFINGLVHLRVFIFGTVYTYIKVKF
jgi:hypothetical protein